MEEKSSVWLDELRRERLQSSSRNPGVAALMSFFVMGLGQIYAGHIDRGIMLLGIQFSSLFAGISLYNKGLVYEAITPLLGTNALVLVCYCLCVVFILLWIYNIKDAYYLTLFSSFRDWFEVERVLLPVLKVQEGSLLTGPEAPAERSINAFPGENFAKVQGAKQGLETYPEPVSKDIEEDADVIIVSQAQTVAKEKDKSEEHKASEDAANEEDQSVYYSELGSFNGQSWKLYVGLILIFILIGLWFQKKGTKAPIEIKNEGTLFSLAGDLPDQETIDKVKEGGVVPPPVLETITSNIQPIEPEKVEVVQKKAPYESGIELVSKGKYAEACAAFEKDLLVSQPNKDAWTLILNAFYRSDNKLAYELKLRKYLEAFADDSSAWFNLGKILYDREDFTQASQALVKGLKFEPDNVRGNFLLGSIYADLKLNDEASVYLRKAVSIEPLNIEFIAVLAKCLQGSGNNEESIKFYQRILSLSPTHQEAIDALNTLVRERKSIVVSSADNSFENVAVIQGKTSARYISKSEDLDAPLTESEVLYDSEIENEPSPLPVPMDELVGENYSNPEIKEPENTQVAMVPEILAQTSEDIMRTKLSLGKVDEDVATQQENEKEPDKEPDKENLSSQNKKQEIAKKKAVSKEELVVQPSETPALEPGSANDEKTEEGMMNSVAIETSGPMEAIEALRKSAFQEYSRGNWEKSLPLYLEYLKKKKDPGAYDIVSIIFEKLGMENDAFDASEHAYNLGLNELSTLIRLGRLAEKTSKFERGEKYLGMALDKSPHRVDLRIRFANCLCMNGKKDAAISQLEAIIDEYGSSYSIRTKAEKEIAKIRGVTN